MELFSAYPKLRLLPESRQEFSCRLRGMRGAVTCRYLLVGVCVLLWCVRDFYAIGKGTLAPWDPPKRLVIVGLYRFTRNPMYVGVLGWVSGWSLLAGSPVLAAYAGVLAVCFHLRVIFYEEPTLARQFGNEWTLYCARVNRWLPKPR